jgi:hypothetical protein
MPITLTPGYPIIIVEGDSDKSFFNHLITDRKINKFDVLVSSNKGATGKDSFEPFLKALRSEPDFDLCPSIIICSDNDANPSDSLKMVAKAAANAGWETLTTVKSFTNRRENRPQLAILMLPTDNDVGDLETILYDVAIIDRSDTQKCIENFISCTNTNDRLPQHMSKYKLRCLVASIVKSDPSLTFGNLWRANRGVPENFVPLSHTKFDHIVEFLSSVPR